MASSDASLLATVNSGTTFSQVYLENTGTLKLHQVSVRNGEKALGTLSELVPGEKKVLAVSGPTERITVSALDQSGQEIQGLVHYNSTKANDAAPADVMLSTKAVPDVPAAFSGPRSLRGDLLCACDSRDACTNRPSNRPSNRKEDRSILILSFTRHFRQQVGRPAGRRCRLQMQGGKHRTK